MMKIKNAIFLFQTTDPRHLQLIIQRGGYTEGTLICDLTVSYDDGPITSSGRLH